MIKSIFDILDFNPLRKEDVSGLKFTKELDNECKFYEMQLKNKVLELFDSVEIAIYNDESINIKFSSKSSSDLSSEFHSLINKLVDIYGKDIDYKGKLNSINNEIWYTWFLNENHEVLQNEENIFYAVELLNADFKYFLLIQEYHNLNTELYSVITHQLP